MTDNIIAGVVTVLTAIVGIAILAVLVGNRAKTAEVIRAGGQAFSQAIGAAVSPVTGGGNSGFASPVGYGFTGGGGASYPEYF